MMLKILKNNIWFIVSTVVCVGLIFMNTPYETKAELECVSSEETYEHETVEVAVVSSTPAATPAPTVEVTPIAYREVTREFAIETEKFVEESTKIDEYEVPLTEEEKQLIYECMDRFNLDFDVSNYYSMIWVESRFKNALESYAGACGRVQIMPATYEERYTQFSEEFPEFASKFPDDIWNTQTNLVISLYHIHKIQEELGLSSLSSDNNFSIVATTYNRGVGGARKLYRRTGSYVSDYSSLILQGAHYLKEHNTFNGIE